MEEGFVLDEIVISQNTLTFMLLAVKLRYRTTFFVIRDALLIRQLIKIGGGVRFGEYVPIYDHNHSHDLKSSSFHDCYSTGQVVIGTMSGLSRRHYYKRCGYR